MNTDRHPHSHFAVTRERAAKRQEWLRNIPPRSIAGRDRKVISVSDHDALPACDRHEELMAADAALSRLRALEAPVTA